METINNNNHVHCLNLPLQNIIHVFRFWINRINRYNILSTVIWWRKWSKLKPRFRFYLQINNEEFSQIFLRGILFVFVRTGSEKFVLFSQNEKEILKNHKSLTFCECKLRSCTYLISNIHELHSISFFSTLLDLVSLSKKSDFFDNPK